MLIEISVLMLSGQIKLIKADGKTRISYIKNHLARSESIPKFHTIRLFCGLKELNIDCSELEGRAEVQMMVLPCKALALETLSNYENRFRFLTGPGPVWYLNSVDVAREAIDLCEETSQALLAVSKTDGWTSEEQSTLYQFATSTMAMSISNSLGP